MKLAATWPSLGIPCRDRHPQISRCPSTSRCENRGSGRASCRTMGSESGPVGQAQLMLPGDTSSVDPKCVPACSLPPPPPAASRELAVNDHFQDAWYSLRMGAGSSRDKGCSLRVLGCGPHAPGRLLEQARSASGLLHASYHRTQAGCLHTAHVWHRPRPLASSCRRVKARFP